MSTLAGLSEVVQRRVDPRPLAVARIIAGLNALILSVEALAKLWLIVQPDVLRLPYIPGIPQMPKGLLFPFMAFWAVQAVAFMIGWNTRISGFILATLMGYSFLFDQQVYSNHLYLLTLLVILLSITDSGAAYSVDARGAKPRENPIGWPVTLMKLQLTIVYGFAALSKINAEYLSGSMIESSLRVGGPLAIPETWHGTWIMGTIAVASILTEIFLALAFWSPRWRTSAVVIGIGFHITILLTMHTAEFLGLLGFALCMFVVYPLFCDMTCFWRWSERRKGRATDVPVPASPATGGPVAD